MNEEAFVANMELLMKRRGIRNRDMAKRMGMSESTFFYRKNRPGNFTLNEINKAAQILQIPTNELFRTNY